MAMFAQACKFWVLLRRVDRAVMTQTLPNPLLLPTATPVVGRPPSCCQPTLNPTLPSPALAPNTHLHIIFRAPPLPCGPHHPEATSSASPRGQSEKRQHCSGSQWHFLTAQAGFSSSSCSVVVLFHPLLETNGSRKIDKSEVTQLLLLDNFSSNKLEEEGMTKKWHFDQTGCFCSKFSFQ